MKSQSAKPGSETNEDVALAEALEEYLRELEANTLSSKSDFIAGHPELAGRLGEAIEGLEFLHRVNGAQGIETAFPGCGLGDYRLVREIGRGGMGIVYAAQQRSLDRQVAVKVLPFAGLLSENQLQRFKNEARAAASLRHPNIVSVFGFGHERGVHYYAMELVEGRDLAFAIRSIHDDCQTAEKHAETEPVNRLSTLRSGDTGEFYRSVARVGLQVSDALHFAHQQGVVHRDIKPANLLLDLDGAVHVTDFGLAQLPDHDLTVTGDLMGTLRYMSPEQLEPAGHVDARTDVYSLGLVLYELLSGVPPYSAESRAALTKQITESPPPRFAMDLPRDLETIIYKSMAKDAIDRYQSAQALADDLAAFLELRSIKAKPPTQFDRVRRFAKRNPALATSLALAMALLMLLTGVTSFAAWKFAAQSQQQASESRLQRIGLYARDMMSAQQLAKDKDLLQLQEVLGSWIPSEDEEDLRGFEWYHLWLYCDEPSAICTFDQKIPAYGVEFLDDDRIATCGWSRNSHIWSLKTGERTDSFRLDKTEVNGLTFDPQNGLIVAGDSGGNVAIWSPDQKEVVHSFQVDAGLGTYKSAIDNSDLNSEGSRVVASGGTWDTGFVRVWDIEANEPALELNLQSFGKARFGRDDELIVTCRTTPEVRIFNSESLELSERFEFDDASGVEMFEVSPDNSLAVFGVVREQDGIETRRVELWQTEDWQRIWSFNSPSRLNDTSFTRAGDQFAWSNDDGQVWMARIDEAQKVSIDGHTVLAPQPIRGIGYSPDGSRIATASLDGKITVWDVDRLLNGPKPETIFPARRFGSSICFLDATGTKVAMSNRGRGILCWDSSTGKVFKELHLADPDRGFMQVASAPSAGVVGVNDGTWPPPAGKPPGRISFWDTSAPEPTVELSVPITGKSWNSTAISPDGQRIAAATHKEGLIIVARDGEIIRRPALRAKSVRWSADGETLVVGTANGIAAFLSTSDFSCEEEVRLEGTDEDPSVIGVLDISRDGRFVAAGGFDFRPKIYDRESRKIRVFGKLRGYPTVVRFSPDGKRLMVGSLDGAMRLFITETGDEVQAWPLRPMSWPYGEFSANGAKFAVAGAHYAKVIHSGVASDLSSLSATEIKEQACSDISKIDH